MKIEQLPSGSYRIRQYSNGRTHSIVLDHKPTAAEATTLMAKKIETSGPSRKHASMTFKDAAIRYIESKSIILSPSTKRSYMSMIRNMPESFLNIRLHAIEQIDVQTVLNDYSANHSPKSVANLYGFICPVLETFRPNLILRCTLPQKVKNEPYIPTEEEVKKVFEYVKGTKYEIPIMLASMGLRRSEICALTIDDLDPNTGTLSINKALVQNEQEEFVVKATKTTDSTRSIILPPYLCELIVKQGYIYKGHPESISRNLKVVLKELGIKDFSLHKLRHFFASYMHNLGFTDKQIQAMGGWRSDVMKNVYQHPMNMDKTKEDVAKAVSGLM